MHFRALILAINFGHQPRIFFCCTNTKKGFALQAVTKAFAFVTACKVLRSWPYPMTTAAPPALARTSKEIPQAQILDITQRVCGRSFYCVEKWSNRRYRFMWVFFYAPGTCLIAAGVCDFLDPIAKTK